MRNLLSNNKIIAAVKDDKNLQAALKLDSQIIFVLYGNICNISHIVQQIKRAGKKAFIHIDLIEGIAQHKIAIDFLDIVAKPDGIISTKPRMLKLAKAHGYMTVLRMFIIDSFSFHNIGKQIELCHPDCIEIMPGVMPVVNQWILDEFSLPTIASGLVCDEKTTELSLKSGVNAISTTNTDVWELIKKYR